MELVKVAAGKYVFQLGKLEWPVLGRLLELYPVVPTSHHRLSRNEAGGGARPADDALLQEAMAEHRRQNQQRVGLLLRNHYRVTPHAAGHRLVLTREDLEWLLQVLNDVRIGSWLKLGCPDPDQGRAFALNQTSIPHLVTMDQAGRFEGALLAALEEDG